MKRQYRVDTVGIWLRRQTSDLLGHVRVGSNPTTGIEVKFCDFIIVMRLLLLILS